MEQEWVDFEAVKAVVTIQMVFEYYGIGGLWQSGNELCGSCPIHQRPTTETFRADTRKNTFRCSFSDCGAHGNIFDFVAAMERCQPVDAAIKLSRAFKVGNSRLSGE